MGAEIIPTLFNGQAHYQQLTQLSGTQYLLKFDYNSRDSHWYLSIHTPEDVPIRGCVGLKLVQRWLVARLSTDLRKPAGVLLVASDIHQEPGLYDLGNGTDLMQFTEPDLPEGWHD